MVKNMDLWRNILKVAFLCFVVHYCKAEQLTCDISQDGPRSTYNIRDPPQQFEKCDYSWSNSTDHSLANDVNRTGGPVRSSSHNHLNSSQCLGNISLSKNCWYKNGSMVEFNANCIGHCKPEAAPQEGNGDPPVLVIVVGLLVSAVVIFAIIILYRRSRKKWTSLRGKTFFTKMYSLVSGVDDPPQQDLEANAGL
ncbi:uncharacterized protein ACNS7B_000684 [Menidia menidia]